MPAVMSSKFMHAQRFLRRWEQVRDNILLTGSERKIIRQRIMQEAEVVGLEPKWFGRWLNKAVVAKSSVHVQTRIENIKYYDRRSITGSMLAMGME